MSASTTPEGTSPGPIGGADRDEEIQDSRRGSVGSMEELGDSPAERAMSQTPPSDAGDDGDGVDEPEAPGSDPAPGLDPD
jgi:hypothetical protein